MPWALSTTAPANGQIAWACGAHSHLWWTIYLGEGHSEQKTQELIVSGLLCTASEGRGAMVD